MIVISVIATIGFLVAIAIHYYQNYTLKPKFGEVINALAPYKAAIELCAKDGSCIVGDSLAGLAVGTHGIPPSISTTYLARVTVALNGTITATASTAGGLNGETFILTPSYVPGAPISWAGTGTCKTRAAGAIC